MKSYTVRVAKTTIEIIDIEVEAEDEEQAQELAEEQAWEIDEVWKCDSQYMDIVETTENEE